MTKHQRQSGLLLLAFLAWFALLALHAAPIPILTGTLVAWIIVAILHR